ncbi:MAG: hypothetical protein ACRC0V_07220 [Fusobacteriaceae bacterium]|uniref:hypothetical protein n=1 Tax=Romboutsia sp. TaxID=1965302 RepID=UPI003F320D7C
MSKTNDVYKVLTTTGNKAVLIKDKELSDLTLGQIGIFDANTMLSVDSTVSPVPKKVIFAVGVDRLGDGTLNAIHQSAGPEIDLRQKTVPYNKKIYTAGLPMIFELSGFKALCGKDYALRMEFRNSETLTIAGYLPFVKTYIASSSCCAGCISCVSGDCNVLAYDFIKAINADKKGLVVAEAINPTTNAVITDIPAFIATNSTVNTDTDTTNDVCMKIRFTTIPAKIAQFCQINPEYYGLRQTTVIPSLSLGFECNGTLTTTQEVKYEEGNGYDVFQTEYKASGYSAENSPNRLSQSTGQAIPTAYFVDKKVKYDRYAFEYQKKSTGDAWDTFELATIVAIPTADTVTRNAFNLVIDAIWT